MAPNIMLYDLARRGGKNSCWSWNVWKVRQVLNYKQIPYSTTWLTHPEIEPTLSALGIPPNREGDGSPYTVPAIRLPSGEYIMDSAAIVQKLEGLYPTPSLHLATAPMQATGAAIGAIAKPLFPVFMPRIGRSVIREDSEAWFRAAREPGFGMTLEEFEASRGGEPAWKAAEANSGLLKALLTDHKQDDGPFVLGSQVSYADFVVVAILESLKQVGQDVFDRFVGWDVRIKELYESCGPYLQKDD